MRISCQPDDTDRMTRRFRGRLLGMNGSVRDSAAGAVADDFLHGCRVHRLGQVGVESGIAGALPVVFATPTGEGDEHGTGSSVIAPQGEGHLVAIHAGEADVQEDEVGLEIARGDEGFGAVMHGVGFVTEEAQQHRETFGTVDMVVHHQDSPAFMAGLHGWGGEDRPWRKLRWRAVKPQYRVLCNRPMRHVGVQGEWQH